MSSLLSRAPARLLLAVLATIALLVPQHAAGAAPGGGTAPPATLPCELAVGLDAMMNRASSCQGPAAVAPLAGLSAAEPLPDPASCSTTDVHDQDPMDHCERWANVGGFSQYNTTSALVTSADGTRVFSAGMSARTQNFDALVEARDGATGALLWTAWYDAGRNEHEQAHAAALSPNGDRLYVVGQTGCAYLYNSPTSPTTWPTADVPQCGAFTLALDAETGQQLWAAVTDGGGPQGDLNVGVAASGDGATVVVTGSSSGTQGSIDYDTTAYDTATGQPRWTARYDGPDHRDDLAVGVAVSPDSGAVYVTGGSGWWVKNGQKPGDRGLADYLTVAYDLVSGAQLWASRYDGETRHVAGLPDRRGDLPAAIGVGSDGTVVVTGSSGLLVGFEAYETDYATVALDGASGELRWVRRLDDGGANDYAESLAMAPDRGIVYVTGGTIAGGNQDATTLAYDVGTGALRWRASYDQGSRAGDYGADVAVTPDGTGVAVTAHSLTSGYEVYNCMKIPPVFNHCQYWGPGARWDIATVTYDAASGAEGWRARWRLGLNSLEFAAAIAAGTRRVFVSGITFGVDYPGQPEQAASTVLGYDW